MDAGAAGRATEDGAGSCREHAAPVNHPTLMADESDERPVSGRLGDGMGQEQPINSMSGLCLFFSFGCISGTTVSALFLFCVSEERVQERPVTGHVAMDIRGKT